MVRVPPGGIRGGGRSGLLLARHMGEFQPVKVLLGRRPGEGKALCPEGELLRTPFDPSLFGLRRGWPVGLWRLLLSVAWSNLALLPLLLRHRPAIVHCNELPEFLCAVLVSKLTLRRTVLHVRGVPSMRSVWRLAVRLADLVVAVSERVRERIVEALPGTASKVAYIPNPVEAPSVPEPVEARRREIRRRLGVEDDRFAVGYVGVVEPKKRQLEFLRLAAIPACREEPRLAFYFLGAPDGRCPEYFRECVRSVEEAGLEGRIKFVGHREDIWDWYLALDAVALASKFEGLARSLIEAMSAGRPVICTENIAPEMLLEREETRRWVVRDGDWEGLRRALVEAARDEGALREAGRISRSMVLERLDARRVAEQVERAYRALLSSSRGR